MDNEEFAHIRATLGWSQRDMAEALGYGSQASVWAIERGRRRISKCEAIVLRLLAAGELEINL